MTRIRTTQLASGAAVIMEPIENVASAAMTWLLPLGTATDPEDADGLAVMLSEMVFRGAGGMTSREHSDAFDRLGAQRTSSVTSYHLRLTATCLGERLAETTKLIAMIVRDPAIPEDAMSTGSPSSTANPTTRSAHSRWRHRIRRSYGRARASLTSARTFPLGAASTNPPTAVRPGRR